MALPELTEATIRQHATSDSFHKGRAYYDDGAVVFIVYRGDTLEAQVEGSDPEPYRVRCTLDDGGIVDATCTCLYSYGGWCKHIVAALLAAVRADEIEQRPTVDALLADLDRDRLQRLLMRLVERFPDLLESIENDLQTDQLIAADSKPQRVRPPDLNAVRRQMIKSLHHPSEQTDHGWYYFHLGPEASQLLEQVWAVIRAGDGRTAMDMLNAMTDECLENWQTIMEDEEGETLNFVNEELGPAWAEAILSADLTSSEREGWESKLDVWASELADYADSVSFDVAMKALQEGWEDLELRRTLQGETMTPEVGRIESYDDLAIRNRLTVARLNVLERQQRYDEYLNLARAEGQVARYTTMLVRQGQPSKATSYGLTHLERTEDALALAQTLREAGHLEEAMRIGERGLELEGRGVELGAWLADFASELGNQALAVRAASRTFRDEKSLASYLRVQDLAAEDWPARRKEMLERLRATRDYSLHGPIDIFLHEGLIGDATALLDRSSYVSRDLIAQVADAAVEKDPDWVIQASRRQAESIMDAAKASSYYEAADWLSKAKRAYIVAGRERDWNDYLHDLLEQHHRKYKLMPLLRALI